MVIPVWTFLEFTNEDGDALFTEWLHEQAKEVQAVIDTRILLMRGMKPPWPPKWIKAYTGYDKLLELRITYKKVQYRPLGCYGPSKQEFTLLVGAIEKGGKISRPTLRVAIDRMELVSADRRWVREYEFNPTESVEKTPE